MSTIFHKELPTELKVMPFILRVMKIGGLWGDKKQLYRFVLGCVWVVSIILFPKAVLGIGSNRFDVIAKGLSEFIFAGSMLVSTIILATNRTYFKQMIDRLTEIIEQVTDRDQPSNCYEEICRQNRTIDKFAKFYAIYCSVGPFVFCVPSIITSYMRYYVASDNNSTEIQFEIPMEQRFYGMEVRTNFVHYNFFLVLSMSCYYVCSYFLFIKVSTMIIMMKYSALVFRLIAIQIRDLTQVQEHNEKARKLAKIIGLHNRAFEVIQLAEQIINFPLMIQFISCMLFWCLTMFYVSTNVNMSLLNVMILFLLSMVETYGYSYLGTEIANEAADVGRAIYELPWYEESVELQNKYRLILQHSQLEIGITAAKFFIVGIEKFGGIVQMSYSYYLVLKNTLSEL